MTICDESKNKDPYTQPSEPILLPKLRIYFADFPYLLCFTPGLR